MKTREWSVGLAEIGRVIITLGVVFTPVAVLDAFLQELELSEETLVVFRITMVLSALLISPCVLRFLKGKNTSKGGD